MACSCSTGVYALPERLPASSGNHVTSPASYAAVRAKDYRARAVGK